MPNNWPKSKWEFERASRVIPGGVNSPARAFGAVGGHPLVIEKGEGPYLFDVDGNRYIDYVGSWGPLLLGHRHPAVMSAVVDAMLGGLSFGAPTTLEADLAEKIVAVVPSVEKVRMVSSGTEATMSALRVARGFTGRNVIVKFSGCYHGHADSLLVQAGSGATTLGVPSSPGVPAGCTADTLSVRFNDKADIANAFQARGKEIAAVIVEPVVGNMGVVAPAPGFLEHLRELTERHGAVLIFDEVMTGFRLAYGGAQKLFGIKPDMTCFGKIVGGGMPVGAYGGRKEIMDVVSPVGPVYQAGTLSGNPIAMACGLETLRQIEKSPPYVRLEKLSERLARGFDEAATAAGVDHSVARVGSMLTLFFNPDPVTNYDIAKRCDTKLFARFFWKMIERDIYLPCSQFEAMFVSAAHTEATIDETIAAAREALKEVTAN